MKHTALALALVAGAALVAPASGVVYINEVFINPPGAFDDSHEFFELRGTPGKKLDGYALANLSGTLTKYYPLGSLVAPLTNAQEIDEFFSLDGLSLGKNGILLVGIGPAANYIGRSVDSNVRPYWGGHMPSSTPAMWNGFNDTPGKFENDGSNTIILIRNRPGATQATHPTGPASPTLRWGKDITHDIDLVTPVLDNQTGMMVDQFGDGDIDEGGPSGFGSTNTLDMKGATTATIADDLEIVDEVSWEHERGWEYDVDERHVDDGSTLSGLPYRHVHALDDPQGINPDCLVRVDYRTSGNGWTPAPGAVGEMFNGNNWQDTATEQWIRGESVSAAGPTFFFDNGNNVNPDSIQPYFTNVPLWLNDGIPPDYNFTAINTYRISPGFENPLAIPFIPGDANRDGVCDIDDIIKIADVFGNDNWVFSNSFASAPEGDGGDPSTQTRPWDVDATGDNGIEPSDLQWTLNFIGNTNGRIVGVDYTGTGATPAGQGVYLNPNTGVSCTISTALDLPPGRTASTIQTGDSFSIDVLGRVSGGANQLADQQNGIMQYVNDVVIASGGIIQVTDVQPLGDFVDTRASIEMPLGSGGDLGVRRINGHTTSFTNGLAAPSPMYRVTFTALNPGSTSVTIGSSTEAKFAASTPRGLKVGHTNNNGNPVAATYAAPLSFTIIAAPTCCLGNADKSVPGSVSFADITAVLSAFNSTFPDGNGQGDADCNGIVNFSDITIVLANFLNTCQ